MLFCPQGTKHLKYLRGFTIWRCLLLPVTSVSSPLFCGSVHTHCWSHTLRCILLWKLEEIAIWVLKHKIKMPFYCACIWGIELKPQFRQLCVSLAIQQHLPGAKRIRIVSQAVMLKQSEITPKAANQRAMAISFLFKLYISQLVSFAAPSL